MDPFAKFNPIANVLNAVSNNQKLVSSNISNAQTPGYTAKSTTFSQLLYNQHSPFETKMSKQMGSSLQPLGHMETGQPVNMKQELLTMQKNMLFYSMTTRRAASVFNMLRTSSQIGR